MRGGGEGGGVRDETVLPDLPSPVPPITGLMKPVRLPVKRIHVTA